MPEHNKTIQFLAIINQVRENLGLGAIPEISPEMTFKEDLEIDSISLEELVVYVEEKFDVELDIEILKTVNQVLKII